MKKNSLSSRALAPAVVLAVGALVATPALAQVDADAAEATNASTATPEATTTEPSETASDATADEATDQTESDEESDSGQQAEAPQTTQPAEEETTESTPEATEEASPEATEDPSQISPTVRMDYPLPAQTVHDDGIEVRVKTAPNAPVDITKASVSFTGGYTLQLPDEWDGTADENGDYVFTIAPDTPITTTFKPEERNTTVGQLSDGDRITVQVRTNGKNTSFTTAVEGTAQEAKPTVTFPDHPDNAATRTIGEDFTARVAYTGATEGDPVTVIVNGYTQKHGNGNYEAPATVTETDGEFEVTLPASFLDEVHSGTADDQDVLQVRVGSTRNHVRITEEEAPAKPTVTFPNNPDGTAERKAGESISVKVRYDDVKTGDPISVVANGEVLTHGEGYQSIQKTDYVRGGFFVRLDGEFLDGTRADGEPERDTVEVRVGEGSATLDILEIADEPTEEPTDDPTEDPTEDPTDDPTEDPEEISPTVRMDYPLPAQTVHDEGIEVRVKTAPNAPVDVTRTSVLFTGGYTLELPDEWDGTADENGDYVFTIAPDTPITSDFRPERNTTVGQLSDGDGVVVQIRSNGKSTSFATEVEGTAVEPTEDPTEEPTDEPTETTEPTETGEPTETADPTPTATETDDADLDPALAIDPQEIAAERFVADGEEQAIEDDRGVTYTVTDVEPGSEVTFDTYMDADAANAGSEAAPAADSDDEPAKSITVTADEDGTATSRVWGETTAAPSAYIGEYSVVATTEDETLEGSFSVVDGSGDGDGGQDDGGNGDDGDNGDDLPRTGSTTAPLVAGAAGLVALGGALVYVARRRQA